MAQQEEELLVEEREEILMPLIDSQIPIRRKGWFPKPILSVFNSPYFPSNYKSISISPSEANTIHFNGWLCPQRQWSKWVEKLEPKYNQLWQEVGIFEAIKVSTFAIRKDLLSILGVVAFWSGETNTFIFPWGESTITIEDVVVLGGFSVIGESVKAGGHFDAELEELESIINAERRKFNKTNCRKPSDSEWISYYSKGDGNELEHVAFLCLWLTRFVFPAHPYKTIGKHVIPIAIRLAYGERIALGPAVLASLYRDLRIIKEHLSNHRESSLTVWAPLQILQLWVWERFPNLRPKLQCFVESNEPRAARWHEAGTRLKALDFSFVMSIIESPDEFEWRPYVTPLDNWCKPSFYKDRGEWVYGNVVRNKDLGLFAYCVRASELVGLDCIEQYLPHRVALQFGLDQDVPNYVCRANSTWEAAWKTYDIGTKPVQFYVPPRLFESDVTLQYTIWWRRFEKFFRMVNRTEREKNHCQSTKKRSLLDLFNTPATQNYDSSSRPEKSQKKYTGIIKMNDHISLDLSSKQAKEMDQNSEAQQRTQLDEGKQLENVVESNAIDINEGITGDLIKNNLGDQSAHGLMIDLEVVEASEVIPVTVEGELRKTKESDVAIELVNATEVKENIPIDLIKNNLSDQASHVLKINLEVGEAQKARSSMEEVKMTKIMEMEMARELVTCNATGVDEIVARDAVINSSGNSYNNPILIDMIEVSETISKLDEARLTDNFGKVALVSELVIAADVNTTVAKDAVKSNLKESSYDPMVELEMVEVSAIKSNSEETTQLNSWEVILATNPKIKAHKEEIKLLEVQIKELESTLKKQKPESAGNMH